MYSGLVLGGVPRNQKMLQGYLLRVYLNTKKSFVLHEGCFWLGYSEAKIENLTISIAPKFLRLNDHHSTQNNTGNVSNVCAWIVGEETRQKSTAVVLVFEAHRLVHHSASGSRTL